MQRFPSLLLAAAILAGGGVVRAENDTEETQKEKESIPGSDDERYFGPKLAPDAPAGSASAAPAPAASASVVATPAAVATPAPAAKVDDKAAKKDDKFPLHANVGLSTSASNAWLAPTSAAVDVPINGGSDVYTVGPSNGMMQPNLATSLTLSPSASIPKLADWAPAINLNGGFSLSVNNWLPASGNSGPYERQVRMSDFRIGMGFPGLIPKEELTGITTGISLSTSVPLSLTSRYQNRLTSLGGGLAFGWSSGEAAWGSINVNYSPRIGFNFYSQDATTIPCEAGVTLAGVVENPIENNELPLQYAREAEIGSNGECLLRGRQGMASLNNSLGVSYNIGDHSVSSSLAWGIGFLRPVSTRPELVGRFASGQNFNENMSGNISYSYSLQKLVGFDMGISAGIGTSGPVWRFNPDPNGDGDTSDGQQELRFPFYDFYNPANGFSSAFVDLSVGI